jgi:hypothetical protein
MTRLQILFAFLTTLLAAAPALAVYSPELGRFRTRDPAGYVGGGNLYEYVGSQPMRWLDPMGLQPHLPDQPLDGGGPDPRNDPNKGCGISLNRYTGNPTGHEWIEIDDPANDRPEGWGFWPENDKGTPLNETGTVKGPGMDEEDPWTDARNNEDVKDNVKIWTTIVHDPNNRNSWPPFDPAYPYIVDRLPDGSPVVGATCEKIRDCVRKEMAKQRGTRYHFYQRNCRDVARSVLRKCGLTVQ